MSSSIFYQKVHAEERARNRRLALDRLVDLAGIVADTADGTRWFSARRIHDQLKPISAEIHHVTRVLRENTDV
jgi:hypothetical protein